MGRPGIMLYFDDMLEPIRMLSYEEKGRLLEAMLEYGKDGKKPELDGPLAIVWSFIRPKIDRDGERYEDTKLQREYAAFCKKRKRIMMPKILFSEWIVMTENERKRAVDPVESRIPTTTSNPQPSTLNQQYTTSNEQSQPPMTNHNYHPTTTTLHLYDDEDEFDGDTAADENVLNVMGGELGQGVVFLSMAQQEDLLDKLGIEVFDKYVKKLSTFILRNDAQVADHYGTILKWWRQDCGLEPRR